MGISEWLNVILIVGFTVREIIGYRKSKAETQEIHSSITGQQINQQSAQLEQVVLGSKVLKDLLADNEASQVHARDLNQKLNDAQNENANYKIQETAFKAVILDHKEDRTQWMTMLQTALDQTAERNIKITRLEDAQKHQAAQIEECENRDVSNKSTIRSLEDRLNIMIGILQKNKLEMPEGLLWRSEA